MIVRSPFSLRSYDLEDPKDLERLRKNGLHHLIPPASA